MTESRAIGRGLRPLDLIAIVLTTLQLALAAWIWRFGPTGPIPMHFDIHGAVNRWGDRREAALVVGGMAAAMGLLYALMPALSRGRGEMEATRRGLAYGRIALLAAPLLSSGLMAQLVFIHPGQAQGGFRPGLIMAGMSLLILVLGALFGKVAPNPLVGVRTYWSLRSRLAWDKSNRLAGRLLLWTGVLGLIAAPIAPQPQAFTVFIVAILGAAAVSMFESWRVWRSDPDRGAAS